jgi:voltage-gated potassium channel
MRHLNEAGKKRLEDERQAALSQLEEWLEKPMVFLGFVWVSLLVVDFIYGMSPLLTVVFHVVWIIFIFDFVLKFTLAPIKWNFLRSNILTLVSLAIPALRLFRIVRIIRIARLAPVVRGARLLRFISSLNRTMNALSSTMRRGGFGYVALLTLVVTVAGAAGMYAFEHGTDKSFQNFGDALWWTAMIMTTMGSEFWPSTAEGRILCFILALYAFAIFGYITAIIATFLIGQQPAKVPKNSGDGSDREDEGRDEFIGKG